MCAIAHELLSGQKHIETELRMVRTEARFDNVEGSDEGTDSAPLRWSMTFHND